MCARYCVAYFTVDPYDDAVPAKAMEAAREALQIRLSGPARARCQSRLRGRWRPPGLLARHLFSAAITRWTIATHQAIDAAFQAQLPQQSSIEDIERLSVASIDVVATAHYAYNPGQWLDVFTAHFGMSDHCDSLDQANLAVRRWLATAPGACPIAAADQEIRRRCPSALPYE